MAKRDPKNNKKRSGRRQHPDRPETIYGIHAALAALDNETRRIVKISATPNIADRLAEPTRRRGLAIEAVTAQALSQRLGPDVVHQGVAVEAAPLPETELGDLLAGPLPGSLPGPLIVLDQVTDPHNVGAILRSAAAFGAAALILGRRHSPPLGGTLAKAASGALEHVPVVRVTNIAQALSAIGEAGIHCIGLDGGADQALETLAPPSHCALVLGSEHKGLRRLTRERCDILCRLTTAGPIRSLNVSNAAAIALHTIMRATAAGDGDG